MRIAQNILEILSKLEINGGNVVIAEKLDRKIYLAVNDVLMACGGVWNRKAKAHVFDGDAGALIDAVITAGEVRTIKEQRKSDGFFETPVGLATWLVDYAGVQKGDVVLEPSAGTGRIVDALIAAGVESVHAFELDKQRALELDQRLGTDFVPSGVATLDFMRALNLFPEPNRVVMNPPFCKSGLGDHLDHVRHAFMLLKPGGTQVSVLPSSVTFRQDKRHAGFRDWWQCAGATVEPLPEGSFKESGTGVNTVVLRVVKQA